MIIENKSKEVINLLEFISCGDDEGDGGDEHHREGEEGEELGEIRGPGIPIMELKSSFLLFYFYSIVFHSQLRHLPHSVLPKSSSAACKVF